MYTVGIGVNNSIFSKSSLGNRPWAIKEKDAQWSIPLRSNIAVTIALLFKARNPFIIWGSIHPHTNWGQKSYYVTHTKNNIAGISEFF